MDRTAVVIGAGMGGLTAARVLSRRYARVTILDRDTLPAGAAPRRGVPQGAQGHILLVSGLQVLAEIFPGSAKNWSSGVPAASTAAPGCATTGSAGAAPPPSWAGT